MLEMSKLIPRLIRDFEFTFPKDNPMEKNFKTNNRWFVKPKGFNVHIQARN